MTTTATTSRNPASAPASTVRAGTSGFCRTPEELAHARHRRLCRLAVAALDETIAVARSPEPVEERLTFWMRLRWKKVAELLTVLVEARERIQP